MIRAAESNIIQKNRDDLHDFTVRHLVPVRPQSTLGQILLDGLPVFLYFYLLLFPKHSQTMEINYFIVKIDFFETCHNYIYIIIKLRPRIDVRHHKLT